MRRAAAVGAKRAVATGVALLLAATGCAPRTFDERSTLHVLAGSELRDMVPILGEARGEIGVDVRLTYAESLEGADRIAAGSAGDAAWFASERYVALAGATSKVLDQRPIMLSPVIAGVRRSASAKLGWRPPAKVGWKDIADVSSKGRFRFAMTSPTTSNSGFSALVGVATALNGGKALTTDAIDTDGLKAFFTGRVLTSETSGSLAASFVKNQDTLDGIVDYESALIGLQSGNDLDEPLDLIYPDEGILTADYPLMLLDDTKREAYDKLARWLRSRDVQDEIEEETARRPAVPGVKLDDRFREQLLVEAPFPANIGIVRRLLEQFESDVRQPSHVLYVLDTSKWMDGEPLQRLQEVLSGLTGVDDDFSGHFQRGASRERVTLVQTSSEVGDVRAFDVVPADPESSGLNDLETYIDTLKASGDNLLYTSLLRAYELAGQAMRNDAGYSTSVVLLTSGENRRGIAYKTFLRLLSNQAPEVRTIPAFVVVFGDAEPVALDDLAERTGGKVFDAGDADFTSVFKEIRGYR
jgi:Ca-activated chloride channel homolog